MKLNIWYFTTKLINDSIYAQVSHGMSEQIYDIMYQDVPEVVSDTVEDWVQDNLYSSHNNE